VFLLAGFLAVNTLAQAAPLVQNCPPEPCCCANVARCAHGAGDMADAAANNPHEGIPNPGCGCHIKPSLPIHAAPPFTSGNPMQGWTPALIQNAIAEYVLPSYAGNRQPAFHQGEARSGVPIYLKTLALLC